MAPKSLFIISRIITYIDKIGHYINAVPKEDFLLNTQLMEACVFNLLQIGELVGHLDNEFKNIHSCIPWAKIRGLRHRIVHDYEGVNLELIWDIVNTDLPVLREQLFALRHLLD